MPTKEKEKPQDVHERVYELLHTRGITAAINGLIAVAEDPQAPAPARATASAALFRAAGFFDGDKEDLADKKPSELSPDELNRLTHRLKREIEERDAQRAVEHTDDDGPGEGDNKGPLFD